MFDTEADGPSNKGHLYSFPIVGGLGIKESSLVSFQLAEQKGGKGKVDLHYGALIQVRCA